MTMEDRVSRYENLLDRAEAAVKHLEEALDEYDNARKALHELEVYYTGKQWKEDYEAEERGLLPSALKRGVLSQDGIDHVLEKAEELKDRMKSYGE